MFGWRPKPEKMKSDSVKGRLRVGSWNSPESPSGATNSQIRGEHDLPLADGCCPSLVVPGALWGCRSWFHGRAAHLSTSQGPQGGRGSRGYSGLVSHRCLRSGGLSSPHSLILGWNGKHCLWASTMFSSAISLGIS